MACEFIGGLVVWLGSYFIDVVFFKNAGNSGSCDSAPMPTAVICDCVFCVMAEYGETPDVLIFCWNTLVVSGEFATNAPKLDNPGV